MHDTQNETHALLERIIQMYSSKGHPRSNWLQVHISSRRKTELGGLSHAIQRHRTFANSIYPASRMPSRCSGCIASPGIEATRYRKTLGGLP